MSGKTMEQKKKELIEDYKFDNIYGDIEDYTLLGNKIKLLRIAAGLSQSELAKRMNTKQSAIARIETGKTIVLIETLDKFAKAIGHKLVIQIYPS